MDDALEEKKRRRNEQNKQRYAEDPEVRERKKACNRASWLRNKDDTNARRRHKYATDSERIRFNELLKSRYGISREDYAAMLDRQRGVCVICLQVVNEKLCVDHDHKTRKVRDLLCTRCNLGLGNYRDDAAVMRRGADYLDYWKRRHADLRNTGPPSFAAGSRHGFFAPSPPTIPYPAPKGEDMTTTDDTTEDNKASRMMRRAILHELLQPFDPDPPPPVDMLQAVARAIVVKASQSDMTAAKEILDRIDGKTAKYIDPIPASMLYGLRSKTLPKCRIASTFHFAQSPSTGA
jgi:hypothetical protein